VQVVPFKIYRAVELAEMQPGLDELLGTWADRWLGQGPAKVCIRNVDGPSEACLQMLADGEVTSVANTIVMVTAGRQLAGAIFLAAVAASGELAERLSAQVTDICMTDLADAFGSARALNAVPAESLSRILRPGSGWLVAVVGVGSISIELLLAPQAVSRFLPASKQRAKKGGLPGLLSVIGGAKVTLIAELGASTLTIGEIGSLVPGDVVRLDSLVSQTVSLVTVGGAKVAQGQLGVVDGKKAVQLL